jgi:cytochrome c-type biogenesis protein CcmE
MAVFNAQRRRRLAAVSIIVLGMVVAAGLGLNALRENLAFFFSSTQVAVGEVPVGQPFRVGGLVVAKHDEQYMPPKVADALKASGAIPSYEMVREDGSR